MCTAPSVVQSATRDRRSLRLGVGWFDVQASRRRAVVRVVPDDGAQHPVLAVDLELVTDAWHLGVRADRRRTRMPATAEEDGTSNKAHGRRIGRSLFVLQP